MNTKQKYSKPKIVERKIKVSLFLANYTHLDEFNIIQQVYASGGCSWGDTSSDNSGSSASSDTCW